MRCPDPDGMFRSYRGRMALFRPRAILEQYWTNHWKNEQRRKALLEDRKRTELVEYDSLLAAYMPKSGLVLEAGCGLGQKVAAIASRGYRIRGIEYDREVVDFAHQHFPDLDIAVGDVHALAESDGSVQTYLSFGVLEHFADGPEPALREVRRVLSPSGYALIMVPLLNVARAEHLSELPASRGEDRADLAFYQYYFSPEEFTALGRDAGLELVEWRGLFPSQHLQLEHPVMSRLWLSRIGRSRLRPHLGRMMSDLPDWARRRYAHMAMYVFRRA